MELVSCYIKQETKRNFKKIQELAKSKNFNVYINGMHVDHGEIILHAFLQNTDKNREPIMGYLGHL